MMISLIALFPNHLNLNGDLANLRVLQKRLAFRGVESQITVVEKHDVMPVEVDFILLGHGSEAAWADLEDDIKRLKTELVTAFQQGTPGLAVASGYERLFDFGQASLGLIAEPVARAERTSHFVLAELGDSQALGYVNSDASLPPLMRFENLFGTLLHGPILAKNAWLAELIIELIFERRNAQVPQIQEQEKADQLAGLISKIWELEEPLTRE